MICNRCTPTAIRWSFRPSIISLTSTAIPPSQTQLGKSWTTGSRRSESTTSTTTTSTTTPPPPPSPPAPAPSASTSTSTSTLLAQATPATTPASPSPINGPLSTRPAPIILPSRDASEKWLRFLFRRAKIYLRFYKTGLLNVWHNYRAAEALRDTLGRTPLHRAITQTNQLSRADFLLLHRSRHDMSRLPLFALVFIVCGEWTPLVVPFITPLVPLTCRLPGQIDSAVRKLEERRARAFREIVVAGGDAQPQPAAAGKVEQLGPDALRLVSASLGLHSRFWGSVAPPTAWLRRRVRKRVEFLGLDDTLLLRYAAGGPAGKALEELDPEELHAALVERGLDTGGRSEGQRREVLRRWLDVVRRERREGSRRDGGGGGVEANGIEDGRVYARLLLTRPSVWGDAKEMEMEKAGS
ncbi:MAG: hypothetical protein M1816_007226 [Peltula sp. TS41687]|nr:MAG: hypothetical protein M1816_007226 [Peltula sp. TS41687]